MTETSHLVREQQEWGWSLRKDELGVSWARAVPSAARELGQVGQSRLVVTGSMDTPRHGDVVNEVLGPSGAAGDGTGDRTDCTLEEMRLEESYLRSRSEVCPQNETRGRTEGVYLQDSSGWDWVLKPGLTWSSWTMGRKCVRRPQGGWSAQLRCIGSLRGL